jgi:hypothetical protein
MVNVPAGTLFGCDVAAPAALKVAYALPLKQVPFAPPLNIVVVA